jgi:hypothetical protein
MKQFLTKRADLARRLHELADELEAATGQAAEPAKVSKSAETEAHVAAFWDTLNRTPAAVPPPSSPEDLYR